MPELEQVIAEELDRFKVPGAAVAVVHDGETALSGGFGLRDVEQSLPVTELTMFPVGSTTKSFTATVVASLVDEGVVEWDRPVREYAPELELSDPLASQQLTIRDMLSHRSGLPRHDMVWMTGSHGAMPRADLVKRLRYLEMNRGLRQEWQYNNLIYMAVGYVIEVVTGMTWEETVAARILEPLGMTNTNFYIEEMQKSDDLSLPYAEIDGNMIEVPFRGIEAIGPAGSMNSCLEDMSRWLEFNVNGGVYEGRHVVSESSIKELQWPVIPIPQGVDHWDEIRTIAYGMGWVIQDFQGNRGAWHNGGVDGFKALVSFLPAAKAGVVVLANRFPTSFPEALSYRLFEELLDLERAQWGERFDELTKSATDAEEQARGAKASRSKDAPPTHPLEDFAGTYRHPAYGRMTFEVRDGGLSVDLPGLDVTLAHRHFDIWEGTERVHGITLPFAFHMDLDGEIDAVEARLEESVGPIVFTKEPDAAPSEEETRKG